MTAGIPVSGLVMKTLGRFTSAVLALGALLFIPAGTFRYWEAWVYMAVLFIPMPLVLVYLVRNDPALLERRMRLREKEKFQQKLFPVFAVLTLILYPIPGLDTRYGWSETPLFLVVTADIVVLSGYLLFFRALRENRFASRIVEVVPGQTVVTTGPYAVIRHPMYCAVLAMFTFTPLALGSYWGMIPAAVFFFILAARIRNVEEVLLNRLEGYRDYVRKTRYRLIPVIW